MSASAVSGAEAVSLYHSSDDEESSNLADLSAMFPTLDHNIILTVLQTHHGQLEAAVNYLMTASSNSVSTSDHHTSPLPNHWNNIIGPVSGMNGQYSEDIGGLPEVVPTFEYDEEDSESDDDNSSSDSPSPSPDPTVPPEDDPLPTYEEACMGTDILPEARYVVDEQPSDDEQPSEEMEHIFNQSCDHEASSTIESTTPQQMGSTYKQKQHKRKGKRKKLKKLAKKLSLKKSKAADQADHKVERKRFGSGVPTPSSYKRLVDGMDMESLYEEAEDETEEDNR